MYSKEWQINARHCRWASCPLNKYLLVPNMIFKCNHLISADENTTLQGCLYNLFVCLLWRERLDRELKSPPHQRRLSRLFCLGPVSDAFLCVMNTAVATVCPWGTVIFWLTDCPRVQSSTHLLAPLNEHTCDIISILQCSARHTFTNSIVPLLELSYIGCFFTKQLYLMND